MRLAPFTSLALACGLALAAEARADTVTFTGFAHGAETVNFSLSYPIPAKNASGFVWAGGFATVDGPASFVSYCVDLYQHIGFGEPYAEYGSPAPATSSRTAAPTRPRPPLLGRRRRRHERQGGRVPDLRLGDRLRDDGRAVLARRRRHGELLRRQRRRQRCAVARVAVARRPRRGAVRGVSVIESGCTRTWSRRRFRSPRRTC
jgi:hypothetical protein